jgi:hypothetical protein
VIAESRRIIGIQPPDLAMFAALDAQMEAVDASVLYGPLPAYDCGR